jgi:formylglycine-generating enzyme required for sulfatase activity/class 3 adenylate cyclase
MSSLDIVPREEAERRLAAILVADVVGYSRLMQADEEGTLARLEEIGANIVDPRVAAHRGRIFRTMGDGLLIEFPSVVEALLCAAEIQDELRLLGNAEPPEQRIQLRIGINIGDIIRKGNDVFGTGVNIAARLESLAEPGSIYISGEAYDQVRDRPFAFDDLGMKAVKNIARLVRVYRVRPGEVTRTSARAAYLRRRNWRRDALVAGSVIGLAMLLAAVVLFVPLITKKSTTSYTLPPPAAQVPIASDEMSTWARIKTSEKIDELSSFLDRFPNSRYAEYVRHRLNALRSHPSITKFRDCAECPEMVMIPAGSFTMGASQSEVDRYSFPSGMSLPLHPVRITRQFALGEFLVTRRQYATFAEETGRGGSGCLATTPDTPLLKFDVARSWRDPGFAQADDHPVVCVGWDDAIAYVSWLSKKTGQSYRLPTEAEWEYAARAGGVTGRYFGDAPICEFANVRDRSKRLLYSAGQFFNECDGGFSNTSPVGSFPPNGFGLYDMIGNVWEWVEDCWKFSYAEAPSDGVAREAEPCQARVRRGASWNTTERYGYTVATRAATIPEVRRETDGFRIARDYPAPASAPSESPTVAQLAPPATSSPDAPPSSDWDGTWVGSWRGKWMGSWRGKIAAKIMIIGGDVLEYDYSGYPQQGTGQTIISGNTLTFRTQRGSEITLTKRGPTTAAAHHHSPFGDADAELVRSSPGAPQSSDWDGTWIGVWRAGESEAAARIIISGGDVLEYDYNGNPQQFYGQTTISGNILHFGTPPEFVVTLTKSGATTAAAHYHGPSGEHDGELVRQ